MDSRRAAGFVCRPVGFWAGNTFSSLEAPDGRGLRHVLPSAAKSADRRPSVEPTISSLIACVESGDRTAADALFAALYSELRRLARRQLAGAGGLTLGTTTLLHEAYLSIAGREGSAAFPDRGRFMGYAARVMRGLVIDYVRARKAQKRGGQFEITSFQQEVVGPAPHEVLARISEALDRLAAVEPQLAELVDLKFFCGFSFAEIGAMRAQSERTVQRHWEKARIYLHGVIQDDEPL
jgi:RNA polymerase sigma factor (TIGR02999 family)